MKYKYPIGIKVKFIYKNNDENKFGTIVGIDKCEYDGEVKYFVFIPNSSLPYSGMTKDKIKYTWKCLASQIEPLKNQQLLFEFMY